MNNPIRFAGVVIGVALSLGVAAQNVTPPMERLLNRADIVAANPFEGVYSKRLFTDTVYITMVTMEAGGASGRGGPQSLDRLAAKSRWNLLSIICCQIERSSSSLASSKSCG